MRALLLAGGEGTRLRPLTNKIPKCMMPINGRPLLDIWLQELKRTEIFSKVLINVHYKKEIVINYLLKSSWKDFVEITEEKELLGTAGTLFNNYNFFQDSDFFVAHADNLCITNLRDFIDCHNLRKNNTHLTMMLFKTNTPETCGIVELDDNNVVKKFFEKDREDHGNLANGAVFLFDKNLKDIIKEKINTDNAPLDISEDIIPLLLGKINVFLNNNIHIDIGNVTSWKKANSIKIERNFNNKDKNLWNDIFQKAQWTY
tara:strand:+ start:87 stop:863 length:777 start_codon:yes stop_codon:yes gene_type:complete